MLAVSALLTDGRGNVLLIRRKRSALWRLPGGEISPQASVTGMLVSLCRRQVGVVPDFVQPLFRIEFSGRRVTVGRDEIRHEQARACGWVEAVQWCRPDALPLGVDPLAAVAISLQTDPRVLAGGPATGPVRPAVVA
jgi:ADP-ribose pyrophosphatase YjhB (NUDIX family)